VAGSHGSVTTSAPGGQRHVHVTPARVLTAAIIAQVAVSFSEVALPTLSGFIKDDLGVSATVIGLLVSAFTGGRILGSYAGGAAADRLGSRFMLGVAPCVMGALIAVASTMALGVFVVLMAMAGIFAATVTPAGGKFVASAFPASRRGFPMGLRQAAVPVGGLLAALVLPVVVHAAGWRAALTIAGLVTIAGGLGALAVTKQPVGSSVRLRSESTTQAGPPRPVLWQDRRVMLLTAWGCLLVGGHYAIITFLPIYAYEGHGMSLTAGTLLVAVAQLGAMIGRVLWGLISDRLLQGRRRPVMRAITLMGITTALLFAVLPRDTSFAVFAFVAFLGGASVIAWQTIYLTAIIEVADEAHAGAVSGFGLTFIATAITVSPTLYGFVIDVAGGFQAMWLTLAAVLVVALMLTRFFDERSSEWMA
jgi:MFS family permease